MNVLPLNYDKKAAVNYKHFLISFFYLVVERNKSQSSMYE